MTTTSVGLDQGSTFLWTEGYGGAEAQGRRRDLFEGVFFAVLVTAFLATSLGMMAYEPPAVPAVASHLASLPF